MALTRDHNLTTGKVYSQVINAERRGDYLGKTVQVIPHVTDAIQDWIDRVAHQIVDADTVALDDGAPPDVCLIEVGGTVGDIESLVFLEALRQFQFRVRAAPRRAAGGPALLATPPTSRRHPPRHPPRHPALPLRRSARRTFASCTSRSCPCSAQWAGRRQSRRSTRSRSFGPGG